MAVEQITRNNADGTNVFQTGEKGAFFGATPVVKPTAAAQAAVTDGSGGAASATTGIQALTSSYNSAILGNAIATLAAQTNAFQTALVNLGLIKGS